MLSYAAKFSNVGGITTGYWVNNSSGKILDNNTVWAHISTISEYMVPFNSNIELKIPLIAGNSLELK